MSLCYDGEKWLMITLSTVAFSLTIGLITLAYGQTVDNQSDFYLEAKVNPNATILEPALEITKSEIDIKQLCPSLQCKIDSGSYSSFEGPDIPNNTKISSTFEIRIHDDITHANLGEKKKAVNPNLSCKYVNIVSAAHIVK